LAELLTGDIDQREAPTLLWKALKICLYEYFDGRFARVDLHTNGRIGWREKLRVVNSQRRPPYLWSFTDEPRRSGGVVLSRGPP
jgi:hypothetical protein